MRISIFGVVFDEKKEFITEYLKFWGNYKLSEKSLELLELLEKETTQEGLYKLLNDSIDDAMSYKKTDKVIYALNPLDILCKMFYLKAKDDSLIDDNMIQRGIQLTKQGLHFYDILYFIPFLEKYNKRVFDDTYYVILKEINNFYLEIQETYIKNLTWIFDFNSIDGVPALIELFGDVNEKIQMVKLYQNVDGECYGKNDSLIQNIINN